MNKYDSQDDEMQSSLMYPLGFGELQSDLMYPLGYSELGVKPVCCDLKANLMYPLGMSSMEDVTINMPLPLIYKFRTSEMFGHVFVPKKNLYLKSVSLNKSNPRWCKVFTANEELLGQTQITYNPENQTGIAIFDSPILMEVGQQYWVLFDSDGENYEFAHSVPFNFPADLGLVEFIGVGRTIGGYFSISEEKINIITSISVEEAEQIPPEVEQPTVSPVVEEPIVSPINELPPLNETQTSSTKRILLIGGLLVGGFLGYKLLFGKKKV